MPKFFVLSDIHGFYNEMRKALDEVGSLVDFAWRRA